MTSEQQLKMLIETKYPLTAKYDFGWTKENSLGSNAVVLAESLSRVMDLKPGMRVMDMGCGKAVSSIFLAKEFGVTVFAVDLWNDVSDNWNRVCEAGADNLVIPIKADVHNLPFSNNFFDAIVCINSFNFYGASEIFLCEFIANILRKDGQFGLAFYGPIYDFDGKIPEGRKHDWNTFNHIFKSIDWHRRHFEKTTLFSIEMADDLDGDGGNLGELFIGNMLEDVIPDKNDPASGYMQWNRMVARRNEVPAYKFWEPGYGSCNG